MKKKGQPARHFKKSASPWRGMSEVIVDGISDALMLLDPHTYEILGANEAFKKAYGLHEGEWEGKRCYEVTHSKKNPCNMDGESCPIEQALREGVSCMVEHRHKDSRGEERSYEVIAYPVRNPSGEVEKVIHVARDITERKNAEEILIRNERISVVNQLVATVSHEIRNPLTGLLWLCKGLSREEGVSPAVLEYVRRLEEAANRIKIVVKKLEEIKTDKTKEYIGKIRMIDLD